MYIGDGAKMIRDAFDLAREKAPTIIFIDELELASLTISLTMSSGSHPVSAILPAKTDR